jgi:hypothetical protein
MRLRIAAGLSLLVTFLLAHPAGAADKMSVSAMGARLAAHPTGDEARTLAEDIRTWFGKDRAGRPNVVSGANPKVEGLQTAWAIEAPGAQKAAIVTSDRQTIPLIQVGDTPVFAATFPMAHGSAFSWTYVTDGTKAGRKGPIEAYNDPPELSGSPACPGGS